MKLQKLMKSEITTFVVLALLVILFRLPSLEEPFDNDSAANAYHARLIVQGHPLYGSHHPAHHLPGVYYSYALGFWLFGDRTQAIKLLLVGWLIVNAWLLYRLGMRWHGRGTGILAVFFFALLCSHQWLKATTAEGELFANLPCTAAVLWGLILTIEEARPWKFSFVGMLSAWAFSYKAVFLAPLAVAGLLIAWRAWRGAFSRQALHEAWLRLVWLGLGFAMICLAVAGYFWVEGLLDRFALVFTLGARYLGRLNNQVPLVFNLVSPLIVLLINNVPLVILSVAGAWHAVRQSRGLPPEQGVIPLTIVAWYLLSFAEAGVNRASFVYYSLIIAPALSLLAAWELMKLREKTAAAHKLLVLPIALGVVFLVSSISNVRMYVGYATYKMGLTNYRDYLQSTNLGRIYLEVEPVVTYLDEHTTPSDYIYVWSDHAHIYYLANRLSPIDTIWPLYAEASGSYQRIFVPQTKYIVVGESILIARPDWLGQELERSYELEATLGGLEIYHRRGDS